jgi:HTH-type transcriptional regulator/antitoxin HigA
MIKPIRNQRDYEASVSRVAALWDARPGTPEHDELEVLGTLIDDYEQRRWPIEPADAVEAIRFRMEQAGFTQSDLARVLGSRARASEILHRRRVLSLAMAQRLHVAWKIPAECLLRPSRKRPKRAA